MKVPLLAFSILLLAVSSCQQQPTETTDPPAPPAPSPPATPAAARLTVAQRFSPIISGSWVSAAYLDEVARTRSPEKSFDHTPSGPSSLAINSFSNKQDSIEIDVSYGLHEGGNLTLLLRANSVPNTLILRESYTERDKASELSYIITATDTTLLYNTRNSKTQQLLGKIAYRRTGSAATTNDLETGVKRGLNKLLLAGRYNGVDSLQHPIQTAFLINGTVEGLPFRQYLIQTDFAGPNPGDEIIFDVYTKQQQEMAAAFGHDTLKLYTIRATHGVQPGQTDTTEIFTRGRLRYQLVRVKRP